MNGILLLDKPLGLSANAALQRVRRLAGGRIRAGHTGSLDPLASGMLPICLGEATRFAGQLLAGRKAYRFTIRLGERTATGDAEGEVIERAAVPELTRPQIEALLRGWLGPHQQVPPMYSALKRDGEPLYRLARQGRTVERAARPVMIERLELLDWREGRLALTVLCSKGTYVRVLGEDLARALGSCGYLESLRRDYVEPFEQQPMIGLDALEALPPAAWPLLPSDRAVVHLPRLQLDAAATQALYRGRTLEGCAPAQLWRLYDPRERFLGLGESDARGVLKVRRLLPPAPAIDAAAAGRVTP